MMNNLGFLQSEIRCDFFVSEKRKKVWKVELDILAEFIRICHRYGLKYFLFAGSLLGAARHQGIIPWDDDVDVAMPRKDYEKFLRVAPDELPEQYVLLCPEKTVDLCVSFSKICNKNTSAMEDCWWQYNHKFEQGIFLDIFPFDNVPDSKLCIRLQNLEIKLLRVLLLLKNGYHLSADKYGKFIANTFDIVRKLVGWINVQKLLNRHHRVTTRYNHHDTKYISFIANGYDPKIFCPKAWAEDLMDAPFEYLTVKIPRNYDEYLTSHFGDWHKFVRGTSCHNGILFDPDRPYTEYLGRYEEFKDASREL